jgi:hypothetical protein
MSVASRGILRDRTRAEEVRSRRARQKIVIEPAPRERRPGHRVQAPTASAM